MRIEELIKEFWALMSDGRFDKVGNLMKEDAVVWLPNTREVFRGRDKYIDFNKKYPGRWIITLEKILCNENTVVSAVKVESEDKTNSFYATSFFTIRDNLICEIIEYWGENGPPPEWRIESSLSERY
jgi:ketosteroid isomerase-like protein